MKRISVFIAILFFCVSFQASAEMHSFVGSVSSPKFSPSGKTILFSSTDYHGLYLLDLGTKQIRQLIENRNGGYGANFSPDGSFIAFKLIKDDGAQIPCLYSLNKNSLVELHAPSFLAGVPSFAGDGSFCFTVDSSLFVYNKNLQLKNIFQLQNYCNLARISPDGKFVAFNDNFDQIWILSLIDGSKRQVTNDQGYFFPQWSPHGKKLSVRSLSGDVWVFDLTTDEAFNLGAGGSVNWADDDHLIFVRYYWGDRFQLKKTELVFTDFQGKNYQIISGIDISDARFLSFHFQNGQLVISAENRLVLANWKKGSFQIEQHLSHEINISSLKTPKDLPLVKLSARSEPDAPVANGFNAPYFHQVYDVPNWFNGHWACGATTALMGLQYYKILPAWPVNCSYPYAHQSSHGRYICEIYSFNGYTYNIGGYDPDGGVAYGGYGFIIQNNWLDTKGNMAKYVRQHGVGSDVDWSPNFSKFSKNIKEAFPVVILNSLTTAGHYILGVGEIAAQHAVIVNDPYGNKNQGYMNYNGKNVTYDWPGYSNGHANLNIVHCFIYMRQGADLTLSAPQIPDTLELAQTVATDFIVRNVGTKSADSSHLAIYLSLDRVFNANDILLAKALIPEIDAGDTVQVSCKIQLPDSLPSYRWSLIARADEENAILETDENNNMAYSQFVLKGYPRVFRMRPIANSTVDTDQPEISAYFSDAYFPVISDSIKLFLDDYDYSDSLQVAGNKVTFQPVNALSHTEHRVRLEVLNSAGNRAVATWTFSVLMTSVEGGDAAKAENFRLAQNYPNPFNATTNIQFELPAPGMVHVEIYAQDGSLVRLFKFFAGSSGKYAIQWDGKNAHGQTVGSGLYFYRIRSGRFSAAKRMIFLK